MPLPFELADIDLTEQFLAFIRERDHDESYDYGDSQHCAFAQFLKSGWPDENWSVGGVWYDRRRPDNTLELHPLPYLVRSSVLMYPRTFGALTERLDILVMCREH